MLCKPYPPPVSPTHTLTHFLQLHRLSSALNHITDPLGQNPAAPSVTRHSSPDPNHDHPLAYVTPANPFRRPHHNLTSTPARHLPPPPTSPTSPHLNLHSTLPHTTTPHSHARPPSTTDALAALARVNDYLVDTPVPHAAHALHVIIPRLPLRPTHRLVPGRPAGGEAGKGGMGGDLVLGILWRAVCGRSGVRLQARYFVSFLFFIYIYIYSDGWVLIVVGCV